MRSKGRAASDDASSQALMVITESQRTFKTPIQARKLENSELKVRKHSELGRHACPFVHPPEITQKNMLLQAATARITKQKKKMLEVSSSLFVLQHLCTNIKISLPEITIYRRRLNKNIEIRKTYISRNH